MSLFADRDDLGFLFSAGSGRDVELLELSDTEAEPVLPRAVVVFLDNLFLVDFRLEAEVLLAAAEEFLYDSFLGRSLRELDRRRGDTPADLAGRKRHRLHAGGLDLAPLQVHEGMDVGDQAVADLLPLFQLLVALLFQAGDFHLVGMFDLHGSEDVLGELEHEPAHLPQVFRSTVRVVRVSHEGSFRVLMNELFCRNCTWCGFVC